MVGAALLLALAAAAVTPAAGGAAAPSGPAPCPPLLPSTHPTGRTDRAINANDLARLRDIGSDVDFDTAPIFAVSPDGQKLAVQLRQGNPDANRVCTAMVVVALDGSASRRVVDAGGDALRWSFPDLHGLADFPTGIARVITPVWLDNDAIAYLKRDAGMVQIWTAAIDGSGARALTRAADDVAFFKISADRHGLLFATRSGARLARESLAETGRRGWRYDDRFFPVAQVAPYPKPPLSLTYYRLDLGSGDVSPATAAEAAELGPEPAATAEKHEEELAVETRTGPGAGRLTARLKQDHVVTCLAISCEEPTRAFWLDAEHERAVFLKRQGWAGEDTAFYIWAPRSGAVRHILSSSDRFVSCGSTGTLILCGRETSTTPRTLVTINPESGAVRTVFNPNPEFTALAQPRVERRHWRVGRTEIFGDLVFPRDYTPSRRFPLIIVQYNSRGFLRGGTGDEYPIFALASRGFFVLSYEEPDWDAAIPAAATTARDQAALRGFRVRRSNLRALETWTHSLIRDGLVDAKRVGLTGLSDGASTVQFAALHSTLFAATAMSSCCFDPTQDAVLGPIGAQLYHQIGWPALIQPDRTFWRAVSWVDRPRRIRFPVLMQLADREFMAAANTVTALTQVGARLATYVFPDEQHVKWQPAHRLTIYQRSIAWFEFWLMPEASWRTDDRPFMADWLRWRGQTASGRPKPRYRAIPSAPVRHGPLRSAQAQGSARAPRDR